MTVQTQPDADTSEQEMEGLALDLKDQMRLARDRIADRYIKLMEERSFDPSDAPAEPTDEPDEPKD